MIDIWGKEQLPSSPALGSGHDISFFTMLMFLLFWTCVSTRHSSSTLERHYYALLIDVGPSHRGGFDHGCMIDKSGFLGSREVAAGLSVLPRGSREL